MKRGHHLIRIALWLISQMEHVLNPIGSHVLIHLKVLGTGGE